MHACNNKCERSNAGVLICNVKGTANLVLNKSIGGNKSWAKSVKNWPKNAKYSDFWERISRHMTRQAISARKNMHSALHSGAKLRVECLVKHALMDLRLYNTGGGGLM